MNIKDAYLVSQGFIPLWPKSFEHSSPFVNFEKNLFMDKLSSIRFKIQREPLGIWYYEGTGYGWPSKMTPFSSKDSQAIERAFKRYEASL